MPRLSWAKRAVMAGCVVLAIVVGVSTRPKPGLSAETTANSEESQDAGPRYQGSKSCMSCHGVEIAVPSAYKESEKTKEYVIYNEYLTWSKVDKHSIAYDELKHDRAQTIGSKLKSDVLLPGTGCLGCHSASPDELNRRKVQGDLFDLTEGVSCENCHGPASKWSSEHAESTFRVMPKAQREQLGMIDLRTASSKSAQCLTCHIGNVAQGKVVTHEMYAAGHPPLPSIEVATFVESIPRHWKLDGEKPNRYWSNTDFKPRDREKAKLAFVGAAVALKTSVKLIADEAVNNPGPAADAHPVPGLGWPDYARFDCWSCHHDLKRDGWRQARGFVLMPGRVPLNEWPTALVEVGIDYLIEVGKADGTLRADFARHHKALLEPIAARPFGQKVPLATAARDFATWSDYLINKLESTTFDEAASKKLLSMVVAKGLNSSPDHDTARHIAWTIKILVQELDPAKPSHMSIKAIVDPLDQGLNLILPAGRAYKIEDQLPRAFQTIGDYEPAQFHKLLQKLADELAKP